MSTTVEEQQVPPAEDESAVAVAPVLGEIVVAVHDGSRVLRWDLGATAWHGLTLAGMAAAAAATGRYLAGFTAGRTLAQVAGQTQVRISPTLWEIPCLGPSPHIEAVAAMMAETINGPGNIGQFQ